MVYPQEMATAVSEQDLEVCLLTLREHGIDSAIYQWFFHTAQQHLCSQVAPLFWSHFQVSPPAFLILFAK